MIDPPPLKGLLSLLVVDYFYCVCCYIKIVFLIIIAILLWVSPTMSHSVSSQRMRTLTIIDQLARLSLGQYGISYHFLLVCGWPIAAWSTCWVSTCFDLMVVDLAWRLLMVAYWNMTAWRLQGAWRGVRKVMMTGATVVLTLTSSSTSCGIRTSTTLVLLKRWHLFAI